MSETPLLDETLHLLQVQRPAWLKLSLIANETGLPFAWLSVLYRGKAPDPGIRRIEILNAYLKRKLAK